MSVSIVVGEAQLVPRVDAAVLTAEPLAVDEVGTCQLRADPGALESVDRVAVEVLGRRVPADQRMRSSLDSRPPVGSRGAGRLDETVVRIPRLLGRAASGGGFDQLDEAGGVDHEALGVEGVRRGRSGERLVVTAETVVEDGARVVVEGEPGTLPPVRRASYRLLAHLGGAVLSSSPARDERRAVGRHRDLEGVGEEAQLADELIGGSELANERVGDDASGEGGREYREQPRSAPELDVTCRQQLIGLVVPEGHCDVGGRPQPPELLLHRHVRPAERAHGLLEDRRSVGVAVDDRRGQPVEQEIRRRGRPRRIRRAQRGLGSVAEAGVTSESPREVPR